MSPRTSMQSSQASSRVQTPLMTKDIPKQPFMYLARKFITKIPPVIKYGIPFAIGGFGLGQIYNSYLNKPAKTDNTTYESRPKETLSPKPSETPIPRSTFNPQHPRTGYRYHVPFD